MPLLTDTQTDLPNSTICNMVIQGDYRYWRMTITNSGNSDINVNVNETVYTVSKGDTGDIWSTNKWSAETYQIGFSCATTGKSMSGSVVCTLYTTLDEAMPSYVN